MIIVKDTKGKVTVYRNPADYKPVRFQGAGELIDPAQFGMECPCDQYTQATHYVAELVGGEVEYSGFISLNDAMKFLQECIEDQHTATIGRLEYKGDA